MTFGEPRDARIAVVGLGYVGLPLAVTFAAVVDVVGFDIDAGRIDNLRRGIDDTFEVSPGELLGATRLQLTNDAADLAAATVYIITAPTPIDSANQPDLSALLAASEIVGGQLRPGDLVIYESTVYPGATEERCVPVLAAASGLTFNVDFFVGYSPERINPGDREHRMESIVKVTAGSTPGAAAFVDDLYRLVVTAGTHLTSSIRVAEAAKVIENTQRDVNIALVNEFAVLFERLGIDTEEVLLAAGSKWNFLPFRPGLVGGHCIGVDPYYLTFKAQTVGYRPELILAGRRLNDGMGTYVASRLVKAMARAGLHRPGARALVLGLTFKENTPDLRNSRVVDLVRELVDFGIEVDVHDPWADPVAARAEYGLELIAAPASGAYSAIVIAVAHQQFVEWGSQGIHAFGDPQGHLVFDVKYVLPRGEADLRL